MMNVKENLKTTLSCEKKKQADLQTNQIKILKIKRKHTYWNETQWTS